MRRNRPGRSSALHVLGPFGRHVLGGRGVAGEQIADDAFRLPHDAPDARVPIHARAEKAFDGTIGRGHAGRESDRGRAGEAQVGGGARRQRVQAAAGLRDDVLDQPRDQPPHQLVRLACGLERRIGAADLPQKIPDELDAGEVVRAEQPGAQSIVDVMGVIGDVVGERRDLRLRARPAPQFEILAFGVDADRMRQRRARDSGRSARPPGR